jgi:hypothetical protein
VQNLVRGDQTEQVQFMGHYITECYWVLQAFLTARFKSQDYILESSINADIPQEAPLQMDDAMNFKVFVTKKDKMIEAYQSIQKLKQLKVVKLVPEINGNTAKVTLFGIFSSKIICKFEIMLNSFNYNQDAN